MNYFFFKRNHNLLNKIYLFSRIYLIPLIWPKPGGLCIPDQEFSVLWWKIKEVTSLIPHCRKSS